MNTQSLNSTTKNRSSVTFMLLVFAFTIPISLLGTVIGIELLPGLPLSSVAGTFCPMIAALVLVYRENRSVGVIELLKRSLDYKRIKAKAWYVPMVLLMPGVMTLEYGLLRLMGSPVPAPQFPILMPLVMFLVFFFAALGEELGWTGYAIDPMQARSNALQASILLGLIWAIWHAIPLVQVGRSATWIAWEFTATVALRVLIVWLYNNTGRSVFSAAVYHAMVNVTWQLFPVNGSFYDPRLTGLIVVAVAVIVTFLWGPKTLAHYRYTQSNT